jgi:hypothetical protein
MSYAPHPEGLRSAFKAERFTFEETSVQFSVAEAGRLVVSSGKIAAGDALAEAAVQPFTQCVPNGRYPVLLAIARFDGGDERIAYARVQLDAAPVANWYPALTATQDARALKPGEIFGYGVESGSGSLLDPQAGSLLRSRLDADADGDYARTLLEAMQRTGQPACSWLEFRPDQSRPENIICFAAGRGDGVFASYFGYSADGRVASLVTDFAVIPGVRTEAPRRRPWWHRLLLFWK